MAINKQYGSLTLDLSEIQEIKECQHIIILKDGTSIQFISDIYSQLKNDYKEFTKTKIKIAVRKGFESSFDSYFVRVEYYENYFKIFINYISILLPLQTYVCKIHKSGKFSINNEIEKQLTDFNFNSTDKETWIKYAEVIKNTYNNFN